MSAYQSIAIDGGDPFPVICNNWDARHGWSVVLDRWPFGRKQPRSDVWMPAVLVDHLGAEVRGRAMLGEWERGQGLHSETARVELHVRPEASADA